MTKATIPDHTLLETQTIDGWTFTVGVLGVDALNQGQLAQVRRHVTDKLASHAKPSPPTAKGETNTGVTGQGFILVSVGGDLNKVFLGIGIRDGKHQLYWEPLGQDNPTPGKNETPQPHCFSSALAHMTAGELLVLGQLAS
jgi:hypothetical protein